MSELQSAFSLCRADLQQALDQEEEAKSGQKSSPVGRCQRQISFKHVAFTEPEKS